MLKKMTFTDELFLLFLWVLLLGIVASPMYRDYLAQKKISFAHYELSFLRKDMESFISQHHKCPEKFAGGGHPIIHAGRPSHTFDTYQMLAGETSKNEKGDISCVLVARFKSDISTGQLPEVLRGKLIRYVLDYHQGIKKYSCYTDLGEEYKGEMCNRY